MFAIENNHDLAPWMLVFAAVVREGGFTAAATVLGQSKSHVSEQVSRLEAALGVRLLHRTTRVVRPTEAGEAFYERCAAMEELVGEARRTLDELQHQPVGRLRISVPVTFGRRFLQGPLIRYLARYPRIDASVDVSDRPVDLFREAFDVAIRVGPVAHPDLVVRKLGVSRRLVVAAPAYLAAHGAPESPEDLRRHACLLYAYQFDGDRWELTTPSGPRAVEVTGRVRSNNGDFLAEAARAGLGLAWLPDFVVRPYLQRGELVPLLEAHCQQRSPIHAVFPSRPHIPLKVRTLVEELQEAMGGELRAGG